MIFRDLTSGGDWTFGRGVNCYARDENAINLNIKTRLLSWVGNCFFALQDGIDWASRLEANQQAALTEELKSNIIRAFGVIGINSVDIIFESQTRMISFTYNIQTMFSPSFAETIRQGAGTGI